MTSKNLFFKLIKQNFKKHIWYPIIVFIAFFIALEVNMIMTMEDMVRFPHRYDYDVLAYVNEYFFGNDAVEIAVLVCIAAFICALSNFSYLHSKMQLDTYHSLPVSRTQLFWSNYLSGILQFIIPFAIHAFICVGIASGKNATNTKTISSMFIFIGIELLVFILAYSVSVIAVELTGNIIISILGTAVLFSYSMLISTLIYILFDNFYNTYIDYNNSLIDVIWRFSPLSIILRFFDNNKPIYLRNALEIQKYDVSYIGVVIFAAVIYSVIAYILYLKRASESAGKSIAFKFAEPIIKTGVVIPAAFFCGLFFDQLSPSGQSEEWFVFGIIFGFIIICLLMEIIFRMDIRALFKHKGQFVLNALCTALIFIVLKNDVLGYNTYVPADTQLQSCAVSIEGLMDMEIAYGYAYYSPDKYRMDMMEIQGNPSVMELARKAAKENLQYEYFDYYEGIEDTQAYIDAEQREKGYRYISFGYKLLNGKTIYRQYIIDIYDKDTYKLLADIFNDYDYKIGSMPLLNDCWNVEYGTVICNNNWITEKIYLKEGMQAKLLETYQSEFAKLTLDDVVNTVPLGTMEFYKKEQFSNNRYYNNGVLIYPQYKETINLLKEYGFDMEMQLSAEDITSISIENTKAYYEAEDKLDSQADREVNIKDFTTEYTDKAQIQEILDNIIIDGFIWQINSYVEFYNNDYNVYINTNTTNDIYSESYNFLNDSIPDFIK